MLIDSTWISHAHANANANSTLHQTNSSSTRVDANAKYGRKGLNIFINCVSYLNQAPVQVSPADKKNLEQGHILRNFLLLSLRKITRNGNFNWVQTDVMNDWSSKTEVSRKGWQGDNKETLFLCTALGLIGKPAFSLEFHVTRMSPGLLRQSGPATGHTHLPVGNPKRTWSIIPSISTFTFTHTQPLALVEYHICSRDEKRTEPWRLSIKS